MFALTKHLKEYNMLEILQKCFYSAPNISRSASIYFAHASRRAREQYTTISVENWFSVTTLKTLLKPLLSIVSTALFPLLIHLSSHH